MRTKATSLPTRSEKISALKFALESQKMDSYKRLELQTKDLSTRRSAVHPVSQVHSVSRSFAFAGERSVDRLIVNSVSRRSVRSLGCSFARASVCSFVCVSGLFSCSSFAQFFSLFMGINML